MFFLYRLAKRLPALWRYRREIIQIIKETGSATVDADGIVWVPTSAIERCTVAAVLKMTCQQQRQAGGWDWHRAAIAFARRLDTADVVTRAETAQRRTASERVPLGI